MRCPKYLIGSQTIPNAVSFSHLKTGLATIGATCLPGWIPKARLRFAVGTGAGACSRSKVLSKPTGSKRRGPLSETENSSRHPFALTLARWAKFRAAVNGTRLGRRGDGGHDCLYERRWPRQANGRSPR